MVWAPFALAGMCGLLLVMLAVQQLLAGTSGRTDQAARHMGERRRRSPAAATAKRLGVTAPGLTIGRAVKGGRVLLQGWEDCSLDIAGPRVGKTTARVVPAILEAPGAVVTTSNKTDAWEATAEPRAKVGPVWTFDPQDLTGEPPSWYWNPLSYVTNEVRAAELADVFAAADRTTSDREDAFFGPKGLKVVAALLLAAASSKRTIEIVYAWVCDPRDDEPVGVLREHGYPLMADSLAGEINAPEKQRGGVYGTAEKTLSFLTNRAALEWVTPGDDRQEFDVGEFVKGTGTLYSLSKEGRGSAGALVAGLTVAVTDAAEQLAKRSPGRRLRVPMVVVLDEAANVCRWPELPNLYSHYGSRGLVLMTFLQAWSQGVGVWGQYGMQTLWSAATVKVYGGSVDDAKFLEDLSRLIGDYDERHVTTSQSRGGRSTTQTTRRRRILDVSELAALPKGRAIVLTAGAKPTLVKTTPFWERHDLGR
jgi:type IV secretory pathway TraG/TraD family ATPase VirD4